MVDAYGETPLPVFAQIAKECQLSGSDTVLEMGCGRGRGVFFLNHLLGCKAIGIDWVPTFIQMAQSFPFCKEGEVSFRCETMEDTDLSAVSAIYLYGTCLSEEQIHTLINRFKTLPPFVKIITVSYPLSDYDTHFHTLKQFTASFPWGEAEIFCNQFKAIPSSLPAEAQR